MAKICVFLLFFTTCLTVVAQEYPRGEVFAGYSYLRIDDGGVNSIAPNIFTINRGLNGWEAAGSVNLNSWFGIKADGSGHYGDLVNASGSQEFPIEIDNFHVSQQAYSFLGGPVLTYRRPRYRPFVQALFGVRAVREALTIGIPSLGFVDNGTIVGTGFVMAYGGGLDVRVTNRLSARVIQADYMLSNHLEAGGNLRLSAGIVFEFGGGQKSNKSVSHSLPPNNAVLFPSLAIRGNDARGDGGVLIVEVLPGGSGESSGLRVGDVIDSVDGKPTGTSAELAAQLANRPGGASIRLGVMAQGMWQTETIVVLK